LLDWQPVRGPVETTVTVSGPWSLSVAESATEARLEGPEPRTIAAPRRFRITDTLIDGEYAVVVAGDTLEQKPGVATVIDLASGRIRTLDGSSPVPTTNGGSWTLGEGRVLHATIGPGRAYCLASVDLASGASERLWCAEPRHGFNGTAITPAGVSLMTFDDQRPSCRTVVAVTGSGLTPVPGVPKCLGWEGLATPEGAVWSVVPDQQRIEQAQMFARVGEEYYDLGPGTSGTLLWCSDAAYFARDPQRDGQPASILRWDGVRLEVVHETAGRGPAFVADQARCGQDALTVTTLARNGDAQVTAKLR
ncbi:MAG: hypothetical protein ACRDOM_00065, partial [Nocardioides sp.]